MRVKCGGGAGAGDTEGKRNAIRPRRRGRKKKTKSESTEQSDWSERASERASKHAHAASHLQGSSSAVHLRTSYRILTYVYRTLRFVCRYQYRCSTETYDYSTIALRDGTPAATAGQNPNTADGLLDTGRTHQDHSK